MIDPIRWLDVDNNVIYSATLSVAVAGVEPTDTTLRINNISADDLTSVSIYIVPVEGYEDTFNRVLAWGADGDGLILTQGTTSVSIAPHQGTPKHPIVLMKNLGLGLVRDGVLPSGTVADLNLKLRVPSEVNGYAEELQFNIYVLYD